MVGFVLVSHSDTLLEGLHEMIAQAAGPDLVIETAGGAEDGSLGTSAPRIEAALRRALERSDGVLVLLDLGSAALSLEVALEALDLSGRDRVRVADAPLVEGAVIAAVQASVGASLAEVVEAAERAASLPKRLAAAP